MRVPPKMSPRPAPTGAPAENVANANERARDGRNESARTPI